MKLGVDCPEGVLEYSRRRGHLACDRGGCHGEWLLEVELGVQLHISARKLSHTLTVEVYDELVLHSNFWSVG
jgi:hypothetical protein